VTAKKPALPAPKIPPMATILGNLARLDKMIDALKGASK
jgi:hypothetical protein